MFWSIAERTCAVLVAGPSGNPLAACRGCCRSQACSPAWSRCSGTKMPPTLTDVGCGTPDGQQRDDDHEAPALAEFQLLRGDETPGGQPGAGPRRGSDHDGSPSRLVTDKNRSEE